MPLLERPGRISLVAVEAGEIVGTASVCPSRFPQYAGCGEVQSLYLLPEAMGKGCGRYTYIYSPPCRSWPAGASGR